jgi:hypothetical protein
MNKRTHHCIQDDCKNIAHYNYPDEEIPNYCEIHKTIEMCLFYKRKCHFLDNEYTQCNTEASFGINKPIYCSKHKKEEMIDVKHKICIEENCSKRASFNYENEESGLYCSSHKKDNMIDFSHRRCKEDNCNKLATYNYDDKKTADYCSTHKKENMTDIFNKHKICKTELCNTYATSKKYRGYCIYCFINLFPDEKVSKNYKTKEKTVSDFIKNMYKNFNIINDKVINGGCSKRRPDLLIDLNTHVIIIEIDEEQHTTYDTICENKRIMEISQDLGHPNIVFIRFNPDSYINKNEKKVKSCWGIS